MDELTLTIKFKVKHEPGTPQHLHEILKAYLRGKGIDLLDDDSIEV